MRRPKLRSKGSWSVDIWMGRFKNYKNPQKEGVKDEDQSAASVLATSDKDSEEGNHVRQRRVYKKGTPRAG